MKIVLLCDRVEKQDDKGEAMYRCTFSQAPKGISPIVVTLPSPPIPGQYYELLLNGMFPLLGMNNKSIISMLSMSCTEHLNATDILNKPGKDARDY